MVRNLLEGGAYLWPGLFKGNTVYSLNNKKKRNKSMEIHFDKWVISEKRLRVENNKRILCINFSIMHSCDCENFLDQRSSPKLFVRTDFRRQLDVTFLLFRYFAN